MFEDPDFNLSSAPDKYGRKNLRDATSSKNEMRKFYELEEDEENELESKLEKLNRMARGEVSDMSSSSSSEEEEEEEEEEKNEDEYENVVQYADASQAVTKRLALVNLDWEKIEARDLFVVFNSFVPRNGQLISVTVYPSLLGMEEMKKEKKFGPSIEMTTLPPEKDEEEEEEDEEDEEEELRTEDQIEAIRKYEQKKMKYYFAVIECDSTKTAEAIYRECDSAEFQNSSNVLELSYVPDEMKIEQKPRDTSTSLPDVSEYVPPQFVTTALQQTKNVVCSWDRNDYQRTQTLST